MSTAYEILKFVHVLLAIIAVGFNASYGVLLARAAREPEHELHVLRTVKVLDDRFANPAYGLLLVTGLLMVFVGDLDLTTFWLLAALVLYGLLLIGAFLGYTPLLRRQIALLEAEGHHSPAYARVAGRATVVGILLAVDVVVIVFLMVTQPTL